MHKRVKTIIACLFISFAVLPVQLYAQDEQHGDHDHNAYRNEIGGALGMFVDLNERTTATGFHIHYSRMFGGKTKWLGISPGLEFLFGDHRHYALQAMVVFRPAFGWWIGAGPGISYFSHHDEFLPSGHIETGYEFEAGQVHFGPVLEYSIAGEEQHFMFGLHLGVPF